MKQFLLVALLFTAFRGLSQSYSFKNYSIADGLAQTQVTAITEDQNGYLWVGTLGGLSRFNGSKFTNYSTEDGLLNNRITALLYQQNELWIGHESGISLYQNKRFKNWNFDKKNVNVSDISYFKKELIISTIGEGLFVLKKDKLQQIKFKETDNNIVRELEQIGESLYLATRSGLYETHDLKTFKKINLSSELNITELKQRHNKLILTTIEGRLYTYDLRKKTLIQTYEFDEMTFTKELLIDKKQQLWVCNSLGLTLFDTNNRVEIINSAKGLPFDALNCIYEDQNGTYWIGSDGKGLFRFAGTHIKYYNSRNGIQSDLITATNQLQNKMIFGTYDQGLIYLQNKRFEQLNLPNNTIWATVLDTWNQLWVGSQNGLFKVLPNNEESFARDVKISSFYKESKQVIWVGSSSGLHKIVNGVYIQSADSTYDLGTIRSIVKYNGTLICGTDGGLFRYNNAKYEVIKNFKKRVSSLKLDEQNKLWIGSEDGLYVYDGQTIKNFPLANQPAAKFINFINYKTNKLYVGTNNGLYVIHTDTKTFTHIGIDEGLINLETNINSSFFDKTGNFWFGTAEGLMQLELGSNETSLNEAQPYLNITSIKVNYELLDEKKYLKNIDKEGVQTISLPYNKNNIIVDLDGVLLKKYAALNYEYWLEGSESGWTPNFSNPMLTLSNISSGEYTLHIRANNGAGKQSNEYRLRIIIRPIFYKTWWFILLVLGTVSLIIYGLLMLRINREKRERYQESLEFKAKLLSLEQQTLNASMNRHFIFNSLNSIQYFINTQDKLSANKFLSNFAKLIRKNLDSSAEDGGLVTLQEELERLELYLSLESMRFKDRFEYHIQIDPKIDLETIKIPSMLFQPYVENSIIHGILPMTERKGKIEVVLQLTENEILVRIDDNGLGIDKSLQQKGLSNGDHKSKGMEITTKRIAILNKINDTRYEIEGPFQLYDENRLINGTRILLKIVVKDLENQD